MPGSSSWMAYAPQGVEGFDDVHKYDNMEYRRCGD